MNICLMANWLFVFFLTAQQPVFAQKTITGTVTTDNTSLLAGVTVEIQNTIVSTVTDDKGNYAISAGDDAVLVFKMNGYRTQEIPVHGRNIIDVDLEKAPPDIFLLTGFNSIKKPQLNAAAKMFLLTTLNR